MSALQRGFEAVLEQLAIWGPRIFLGVVLLVVGWILAKLVQRLVTALAVRLGVDRPFAHLAAEGDIPSLPPARLPSRVLGVAVFWLVMLFAAVSFLTMVQLESVALPLQTILVRIGEWLPGLLAASALTIIGWVLATLARHLVMRLCNAAKLDERLKGIGAVNDDAAERQVFSNVLGVITYVLILALFLMPALDALGMTIIAVTVQNTMQTVANAIPGILAAAVVLAVAALIGYLLRGPVTRLVAATGVDRLGRYIGLDPERDRSMTISSVVGQIVFWLVLLFAFPAALDRLGLQAVVVPLRDAWANVIAWLPGVAAAIGLMLLAVLLGRIVAPLVEGFLHGVGFDSILARIGLLKLDEVQKARGDRWLPSKLLGAIAAFVIYLMLGEEALYALGLTQLGRLVGEIIFYLPNLFVAVAILAVALFIANWVSRMVRQATTPMTEVNSELAAGVAYVAITVFGAAMAIEQLAVGGALVQNAVLLIVGAFCLAAAIALGLGLKPLIEQWAKVRFTHWVDRKPEA